VNPVSATSPYGRVRPLRRPERGIALLALLLLGTVLASAVAVLTIAMTDAAGELRARSEVLCARYAAQGGLVAGRAADNRPELVSASVEHLAVQTIQRRPSWCVLRATARCGSAVRSAERAQECAR
jgi:hypothetical protein